MALDLSRERYGSKKPANDTYVSGAEIMARAKAAEPVRQANKFISDTNKFYRSVDMDTTGENWFNAADYFEERKKQSDALKQRAATLSLYMNDHMDSFSQESYDSMMQMLSSFDTEMDDVMSRYQPSIDARTGMRAYEDELRAAMERNEKLNRLEGMASYALDPSDYWGNLMRQGAMHTEGDRGINENWSAEQRYRLGQMQMEDPKMASEYAKQVNAGQDPYLLYQQQEQQKANWRAMDLNAEKREIDRLKAELDDYYWNSNYDATSTNARNAFDQEVKRREQEISDREQQYNLAKREQDSAQFRSAVNQSDFAARSGYVSTGEIPTYVEDADPNTLVYEYINDPEIRNQINQQTTDLAAKGYDLLNEEEVSIYNYYYATEGPVKAQQYLDNIQDTLNQRIGERGASAKQGNIWKQLMAGAIAGYSNAVTAPQYFFDKDSDYINTNPSQYMSAAIREDLADTGPVLPGVPGGASMGQMAYDLVNTTANMAPAILLSGAATAVMPGVGAAIGAIPKLAGVGSAIGAAAPQIGAAVGSAAMGLSAAGSAYQQALNAGYSKEQAKNYAALSGASEIGLEYLLGGISKLGGEIPQSIIKEIVGGVDNAIARAAITLGGSMASEGFEEGLQEVITPWIENLTLYAGKNVDWNEVAYSTLLGALSGGLMEGPSVVSNEIRTSRINNLMDLAAQKVDAEMAAANMTAEQIEEMKPTTSEGGNARQISRNESINVDGFSEVKDGKATVKTDSGTVDYSDVSFGTEKQGNQYFAVESLPLLDTEHANKLLHTIQEADAGNDTTEVMAIREAYRLGYMNATTQELRGSDANVLPTNLQDQIYSIGQEQRTANDAVRATVKAVPTKATGKYKKVVIEGKLSKLNGKRKAEIAYMDRVADEFAGTAVHVYESYKKNGKMYYRDNSGKEQLAPNGKYVNGEIWVDLNSGDNGDGLVLNTFAHEMYHHIEEWNKPKARELAEFVVKELGLESVDKAVQKQIDKARAAGWGEAHFESNGMSKEQAANEVYMRAMSDFVADSLETMFTRGDPAKAIANLKKDNQGLFDQIKAFIDEWISKVKKFYSDKTISKEGAMVAQLEKFEQLQQLFMEAMQGAGENYQTAEVVDEKSTTKKEYAKFSYAGRVALTADESALQRAEELAEKGVDNESIRQQTGWFMGRDGKWRFEIDDSNMRVDPHGDIRGAVSYKWAVEDMESAKDDLFGSADLETLNNVRAYNRAILANDTAEKNRLYNQLINGHHAYRFRQYAEAREHVKELSQKFGGVLRPGSQLGDYVQHDALFEAYPQLQSASFRFGRLPSGTRGQYNPADNSMIISNEIADSPERTIIHEIQHAIQKVEGFASGASPEYWEERQRSADSIGVYDHKIDAQMKRVDEILSSLPTDVADEFRDWSALYKQNETAGMVRAQELSDGQYGKQFNDYFMTTWDLEELLKYNHKRGSSDLYRNTAGEIEARDTANRLQAGLNAEGRKNTPPDLGDDRTVFADRKAPVNDYIPGDISDNELETGINEVADMSPIASISGKEFTTEDRTLLDDVDRFFKSIGGQVYNSRLGDINLTRRGVKDSLAHGMTPEKASAFAAIPNVLQDGKVVGFEKNWKSRGYDSATIAAPITISGEEYLMAVIVHRSNSANRFYVHDVFTIKKEATPFMTGTQNLGEPGGATSTISIIRKILAVKRNRNNAAEKLSLRNQQPTTREILSQIDISTRKKTEAHFLGQYQENLSNLAEQEPRLAELNAQIKELYKDQKGNLKEITRLQKEQRQVNADVNRLKGLVNAFERSDMGKRMVAEYKLKEQKQQAKETRKDFKTEQKELIQTMQAEQRAIREELTGKISDVTLMEREFIRLAKKYEQLDTRTGKSSIKDAKTIAQLKADLKAEAKSHKEDSKIWEREFNRLLTDYETAGRQIARLEATIARQRATAKARVEGRRKTEMRHKIQRKVNELDQLLRHGTKHRNVPEFLQDSVAAVLQAINMEVRDGEQRRKTYEATIARYDRQIAAATDPATVSRLIEKRNEYAAKGDQFANRMDTLQKAYEQIRKENTGLELDEGIAEHLNSLFETVGDTPLGQMTAEQLDAVNDILNVTMATVRNANEMLAEARSAGVVESSKSAIMEIKSAGETKKKKTPLRKKLEQFGWNNLKPVYAFDVIGSKTLTDRYEALRKGEDTLAVDLNEAKEFFQEQWKKNGGKEWDMEQKWKFTSTSGKSFELDLNQIMSLYALAKDKDARSHLRVGGFAFDSDYQTKEDINLGPVKIPVKVESTDASAYNLSDEILGEIISKLTPQQRAFADAMQAYLSDTMAAKGNEVSLKKYGIRLFKKKDYFPIRVADQFMAKAREQQSGDREIKNSGFTKDRKPEAKNPVVLSGFTEIWAEHVDEMSLYHSFVLPLDDFNRVLNYHDAFVEGEQAASVVEAITNAFGKGAVNYIDQLIKDVNGGIKGGSTVSFANSLVSKAKKAQTMASLSVAIQQPSSIIRAMSEVDTKYFYGPRVTEKSHDRTWDEIKKHAPIAIIKEMGGYDTNVGKSTVDYLTDTADYNGFGEKFQAFFKDENFRDDAFGRLPALMDEMSWGVIWNAVKREQRDRHPNMDTKSDAFMKLVANRFTEVITRTQVYDSVFSRSGLMRDRKSDLAKMITSFMAEPTTTANMLAVSILQASRGDIKGKQAAKTVGSIVASLALNAALVSVVYALRDDDEDKRYDEKWIENFRNNFIESLNPLGYIPYVRDIYNLFAKGYDVERADMELFGDLQNAIEGLGNEDISAWEKTENVIGAIGNLLGVPLRNILRDGSSFTKTIFDIVKDENGSTRIVFSKPQAKTKTGTYMAWRGMDLNDKEQMILAIQSGDEEHLQRVFGRFENQQKAESALQSAIKAKYLEDGLSAEETAEMLDTYFDRDDEHEIYWLMEEWDYAKANDGSSDGYTKYGSLYEAIETGKYESEIARFLEHGADASSIRSQITKEYRKQYLADEEAREGIREKLRPVYEATGMYADDIEDKFNDWDFEAEYGMTYGEFKAEYREGLVTETEMRGAMKFYGLMQYEIEEGIRGLNDEIKFVNKYDMTLSEMKDAYDHGDISPNQMRSALVFDGMTQKEAREWVTERDIENRLGIEYAKLDDAYKHGDISRTTLRNAIIEHGETPEKADEAMMGYDWLKKNVKKYPDLTISDGKKFAVRIHSDYAPDETLEDYGVSIDAYVEYQRLRPECKGVDANGDGKTDDGTLRDSIFQMIDSLPITSEAKDGLALMSYSAKSIRRNAPWH